MTLVVSADNVAFVTEVASVITCCGAVKLIAPLMGWVVCQNVPDTGWAVPPAMPCTVKTAVPGTPAVPPPATIHGEVLCVTATVPVMVVDAKDTGCVVCQNVPVTGVVGIAAMETGCVACQKVPVTAMELELSIIV